MAMSLPPIESQPAFEASARRRVMLLEDDADHQLLELKALRSLENTDAVAFDDPEEGLRALDLDDFDLIVADYHMPKMDGLTLLRLLNQRRVSVPVIMVTGLGNERVAVEALRAGAFDYVVKEIGYLDVLPSIAERAMSAFQTKRQLETARRELEVSEERYRELVHNLDALVWEADPVSRRYTFMNRRAVSLLGHALESWLEDPEFRFTTIHPDDRAEALRLWDQAMDAKRGYVWEYRALTADGRTLWLRDMVRVVTNGGVVDTIRGLTTDITEQKLAEEERETLQRQLLQAQKLESVGTLAGGIAHDFNNFLQGILGNAGLALQYLSPESPISEQVEAILQSAERARHLTTQLLAFSRPKDRSVEVIELNHLVEQNLSMLRRLIPATVEIRTLLDADSSAIEADPGHIDQILVNLCVNARDAMPDGGLLKIETKNRVFSEAGAAGFLGAVPGGRYVILRVSDTGCGIPLSIRDRLFDPFFTTKEVHRGTGLGLAIAYAVARNHKGWIDVRSVEGRGSVFEVYLPVTDKPANPVKDEAPAGSGRGETVLVVDDERTVRVLACRILGKYGYRTLEAVDGKEALRVYRERMSEIDLVLLDMTMPRLDGAQCVRQLRAVNPRVKSILSSGYTESKVDNAPGDAFLHKPYRPEDLARAVRRVLDGCPK